MGNARLDEFKSMKRKINNGVINKFVREDELPLWLEQGWNRRWIMVPYLILGICIILSLTGLSIAMLQLKRHGDALALLSVTDPLTGLLNRHGFDEAVQKRMKADSSLPCVGMQMDIDDFKFINDLYGHDVGDQALQVPDLVQILLPGVAAVHHLQDAVVPRLEGQVEDGGHFFAPGHGLKQLVGGVLGVRGHESDEKISRNVVDGGQQVREVHGLGQVLALEKPLI